MARQEIKLGTPPTGVGGDTARSAFEKTNANFEELYERTKQATEEAPGIVQLADSDAALLGESETLAMSPKRVHEAFRQYGVGGHAAARSNIPIEQRLIGGVTAAVTDTQGLPEAVTSIVATLPWDNNSAALRFVMPLRDSDSLEIYVLPRTNNIERAPLKLYHNRNVVGTVSQSGGVPTGSIIETATGASGTYIRIAGGIQICWRNYFLGTYTQAKNGASIGNLSMPAPFTENPLVLTSIHTSSSSPNYATALEASAGPGLGAWTQVGTQPLRILNDSEVGVNLRLFAIGPWH